MAEAARFDHARRYDGATSAELAATLGVPRVCLYEVVTSTMDVAHEVAAQRSEMEPVDGTLVLADEQTEGRGRFGRAWRSDPGRGVWLTLLERPQDPAALDVLSIRVGLAAAQALDHAAGEEVGLKWPNDLLARDGKLGGILVESRWHGAALQWVAIGVGVNLRRPIDASLGGAGLPAGTSRLELLRRLVPAIRTAARRTGHLGAAELENYRYRDRGRGRRCREPVAGQVAGIAPDGALLVETQDGILPVRAGSLVFESEESQESA